MTKAILLAALAALALFTIAVLVKSPRHDRAWADDVARLPQINEANGSFTISDYRTWAYDAGGPTDMIWTSVAPFSPDDIRQTWFVVEPHPGVPGMAHTMIVFELIDDRLLGISVEARKEQGEPYGIARGAFNGFELIYVWASPQDMLTRRVRVQQHDIFMYRLQLTEDEARAYMRALIGKTNDIERAPRFYNTFLSNCTNELAKTAGLPWHPAFIFTGNSASALYGMDRIEGEGSFDEIKARAKVTDTVRQYADADEAAFNAALMAALKPGP